MIANAGDSVVDAPRARIVTIIWLLLLVAALLRLWGLGDRPLWLDEAFTAFYARIDWAEIVELRRTGTNPPLYHFFMTIWVQCFGDSEASLRLPSALFGIASVAVIWRLAFRIISPLAGLFAAALLALSNLAVCFSMEARFYSLNELLALGTTWAVYSLIARPRPWRAAVYVLLAGVFVWVHLYAWFVIAAQAVWVVVAIRARRADPPRRRRLIVAAAGALVGIALLFAPWAPVFLEQIRNVREGYWIRPPGLLMVAETAQQFVAVLPAVRWPAAALALALGMFLAVRAFRPDSPAPARPAEAPAGWPMYLAAWLLLPVGIPLAYSLLDTPIYLTKYAIVAQPAAVLLLAHAFQRWPATTLVGLAFAWAAVPVLPGQTLMHEDWRSAAAYIRDHAEKDATVYVYKDDSFFGLDYYLHDARPVVPVAPAAEQVESFVPYYPTGPMTPQTAERRILQSSKQSWVVLRAYGRPLPGFVLRLRERKPAAERRIYSKVQVFCFGPDLLDE